MPRGFGTPREFNRFTETIDKITAGEPLKARGSGHTSLGAFPPFILNADMPKGNRQAGEESKPDKPRPDLWRVLTE